MMLSPDLLDRRAVCLLQLVDPYGRAVDGPVELAGDGLKTIRKSSGRYAVVAVAGLEDHISSFTSPPAAPTIGSLSLPIDITPASATVVPRRFELQLPRDPNPDNIDQPDSLFGPVNIVLSAAPGANVDGSACAIRASVKRRDDGRVIEGALVRAESDNGLFTAQSISNAKGEACLVFPALPLSFTGAGASVVSDTPAKITVDVDPATARFHREEELIRATQQAVSRTTEHIDPDAFAASFPADFSAGAPVRIAAGRQPSITIEWEAP